MKPLFSSRLFKQLLIVTSLLGSFAGIKAQKVDSILNVYAENFQPEKAYLHFDKTIYNVGETIWYKAYVTSAGSLSDNSKTFYTDWYDEKGNLLRRTAAPMFMSSSKGQFVIPTNYPGTKIVVRAYTKWMLNFDSAFLFEKVIPVYNKSAKSIQVPVFTANIHFFPEGGDLYQGITSRVAFKAENQFGNPVYVKGAVKNNANKLIDSFVAVHDGMGSFEFEPKENETYRAEWIDEYGKTHTDNLPATKPNGATLDVETLNDKVLVISKRTSTVPDNFKTMYLMATMNQQMVYRSRINFASRTSATGEIPTTNLPSGVLQITLFTSDWKPVAERITFINNNDFEFIPSVRAITKGFDKRKKNVLEVEVGDTLVSNMSISVTDADLPTTNSNGIISQLLLAGDLKGNIPNADYYFSSNADTVANHLDLVMLTHGWRRYKWDEIIAGTLPNFKYGRDTDYIQIRGKVYGNAFEKKSNNKETINLFIQGKDSSKQFIILSVNPDGTFAEKNMMIYDTVKLFFMFNGDRKLTDRAEVKFDNGLLNPNVGKNNILKNIPAYMAYGNDQNGELRLKYYFDEQERLRKFMSATTLQEVVVTSRVKSKVDLLDEKYASGMFTGGDGYQFDIDNDIFAAGKLDVFQYLQGKVAGLMVTYNGGDPVLTWRGGSPEIFLDEIRLQEPDMLIGMPMSNIAYVKVFRPPFFGSIGGGASGAIAVYTKKGNNGQRIDTRAPGLSTSVLGGYSTYKEFFSPNYETNKYDEGPDLRTTLYWNPYILTDRKNKTVQIQFFNNDSSKKFKVVLEGMNSEGKIARIEKIIQ